VFFDLPAVFDLDAMLSGGEGIRWEPDAGARIGVLDRAAPEAGVRWFEVEPFFMFHVLNAWDDGDAVVVEGCRSDRLNTSFGDPLDEPVRPYLHRWRLDVVTGEIAEQQLDDRPGDFPRVDDARAGQPTRFGYLAHPRRWTEDEATFDGIVKHDLVEGTSVVRRYGDRAVSGEPLFVGDPERESEDGGWLLNLVQDPDAGTGLVVLDAETLEEVARVHVPVRVPSGFHGSWVAGS
jgi:carotenoid cleavage dioxygenase-like enzyme